MNVTTKRLRTIDAVGVAAALLLTAAVYVAGVEPIVTQHQQRQVQREQLKAQREQATDLERRLSRLRGQLQRAEGAAADHTLRLEPISALNARVARLAELANGCGLTVDQVRPGEPISGEHYHTVPIELVGEGSYADGSRFLHRVHETMPDIAAASLSLRSRPGRDAAPTFVLHLLWYADPSEPG